MSEVIARHQPVRWWMVALLVCYTAMFTVYLSDRFNLPWYTAAAISAVVLWSCAWLAVSVTTTALVLTPDELRLQRRLRPRTIRREKILAVHGDVPHRPTWSGRVLVETTDGTVKLPVFPEPSVGDIIHRLQDWSGTGEPDPSSHPAPRPTENGTAPKSSDERRSDNTARPRS